MWTSLLQLLGKLGAFERGTLERLLKLTQLKRKVADMDHVVIVPHATYAPWYSDKRFAAVYDVIKPNTKVDIYRCYDLWHLTGQSKALDGDILEVGVWRGGTGCLIAARAQQEGMSAKVFLADTFQGVVKAGSQDTDYSGGEHANTSVEIVQELAKKLNLPNVAILKGIFPEDTGRDVAARRFRFCHIDVDVYQSTKDVVEWIWDRLVPGGIIVFDDYGMYGCEGVTRYGDEMARRPDALMIYNINGHAIIAKRG